MFKVITRENAHAHPETLASMFQLRHEVFIGRLGWELGTENGLEKDQFDHDDAAYLTLENRHGQVVASARMLPTTRPYLMGDVFPELLGDTTPPASPGIWEVTRLAVDHRKERLAHVPNIPNVAGALWCSLMEFGLALGLDHLISVSDIRLERIMKRAGWRLQRLGPALEVEGGGIAGEISGVSYASLKELQRKCKIHGPVLDDTMIAARLIDQTTFGKTNRKAA